MLGKSFLSFLAEAPEDIVSVTSDDGEERQVMQPPNTPLLNRLRAKKKKEEKPKKKEAPVKVSYQDPWDDNTIKRPAINPEADFDDNRSMAARRRSVRNPEVASILRANPFIAEKYYDNEEFADLFDNDVRFREHFREKDGKNLPDTKGEEMVIPDMYISKHNERLRALLSGKIKARKYGRDWNHMPAAAGAAERRQEVMQHPHFRQHPRGENYRYWFPEEDFQLGNMRGLYQLRNRERDEEGYFKYTDEEKARRNQGGRQFDLNDPDVFEDYYKSIRRILQDLDVPYDRFDDPHQPTIEDTILNLMNSRLEQKVGDYEQEGNQRKRDLAPESQVTARYNAPALNPRKFANFIHQIPDEYDLSDPEMVEVLEKISNDKNMFDTDNLDEFDRAEMDALRMLDMNNPTHVEFLKGAADLDAYKSGWNAPWQLDSYTRPQRTIFGMMHGYQETEDDWMHTDNGFDRRELNDFLDNYMNEDNARDVGHLMKYLDEFGGLQADMDVHPFIQRFKEFMNTKDVNKLPSANDWQDFRDDNEWAGLNEADMDFDTNQSGILEFGQRGNSSNNAAIGMHALLKGIADQMETDIEDEDLDGYGSHRFMFDPDNDEEIDDPTEEIYQRLHETLFSFMRDGVGSGFRSAVAEEISQIDHFPESIGTFLERMISGEDQNIHAQRWREQNQRDSFPDNLLDHLAMLHDVVSGELNDNALANDGSNVYSGDYYEDTDLLYDYDSYFHPDSRNSLFDIRDEFNTDMESRLNDAEEQEAEYRREQEGDDEDDPDEALGDHNHPRLLWGAEDPEDAPRPEDRGPIDRMKDRVIRGIEGGIRGAGGAAYQAVQGMSPERRRKIEDDPRAQRAYNAINNLNLRGQPGAPDPDATGDDRWRGSSQRSYRDDHTGFGLTYYNNPNTYNTDKIPTLDNDLRRAGLSRGDLRRAVYIAWSSMPNNRMLAQRYKEKTGKSPEGKEFENYAKRAVGINAIKNWKENILPDLNPGDILYNTPIGGAQGERALLYQRMGFGKSGPQGQQAVVGKDGKVYPLNPPGDRTMAAHRERRQASIGRRRERAQRQAEPPAPPAPSSEPPLPGAPQGIEDIRRSASELMNAAREMGVQGSALQQPPREYSNQNATFTTPNGVSLPSEFQQSFDFLTNTRLGNNFGFFNRSAQSDATRLQNEPYSWLTNDDLPSQLDGNEDALNVARSLARQLMQGRHGDAPRGIIKSVVRQILMNFADSPAL